VSAIPVLPAALAALVLFGRVNAEQSHLTIANDERVAVLRPTNTTEGGPGESRGAG